MNILVVEDDPDARKVLSLILKLDGFEVSTVSGGREAIDAIRAAAPDLILLDVMMPDVDGFEVCRRIRSEPATSRPRMNTCRQRCNPHASRPHARKRAGRHTRMGLLPKNCNRNWGVVGRG